MNDFTIIALIYLFVLCAGFSKNLANSRKTVEFFLVSHTGGKAAIEFLKFYDELADYYQSSDFDREKLIINSSKICENIQKSLSKSEQILTFLWLLELINISTEKYSDELIFRIKNIFDIDERLFRDLSGFCAENTSQLIDTNKFMILGNKPPQCQQQIKFVKRDIRGYILFLFLDNIDTLLFKYIGNDCFNIESNRIEPKIFYIFNQGDIIRTNNAAPIYYAEIYRLFTQSAASEEIILKAENIEYYFDGNKRKNIGLHKFSFTEESGQLIAVMGGSGAGKSTLLNVLNGNLKPQAGTITINGLDIHSNLVKSAGLIGFVPQEDMLLEELTVYENLYYSAKLSLANLSKTEVTNKIDNILNELDLLNIRNLKVGGILNKFISGGQRKRLNIALELIRGPVVLYVDEPTSGLSSIDSEKVILSLKQQSKSGKLIIINIHQPSTSIFKMIDKLWILDKGGRIVYTGNPLDALTYFKSAVNFPEPENRECSECGNVQPELIFEIIEEKKIDGAGRISAERKHPPEYWSALYAERQKQLISRIRAGDIYREQNTSHIITSDNCASNNNPSSNQNPSLKPEPNRWSQISFVAKSTKPSPIKQFLIYFNRNVKVKFANKQYLFVTFLQTPILALVVAYFTRYSAGAEYVFGENKHLPFYIFMSVIVSLFSGMMASAEEIIKDRKILKRESFLNLSWTAYINSKIAYLILLSAFQTTVYLIIGNNLLQIRGFFWLYWIVLFSASCAANFIGLSLSNSLNSVVAIYILIPLILIPQILLSGLIIEFDDLNRNMKSDNNILPVAELMTSRWAFEALATAQFKYNDYQKHFFTVEKKISEYVFYSALLLPELINKTKFLHNSNCDLKNKSENSSLQTFTILANELNALNSKFDFRYSKFTADDIRRLMTNPRQYAQFLAQLESIKNLFLNLRRAADKEKDTILQRLTNIYGLDNLELLKKNNHNEKIAELVKKSGDTLFFKDTGFRLVRLMAPVYKDADSVIGRAHFYAAQKRISDLYFETPAFNVIIIWLQSLILYFALLIFKRRNR